MPSRHVRGAGAALGALLCLGLAAPAAAQKAGSNEIIVTLLGTGSPTIMENRTGPSTLVQAGSQTLVFDAGRGSLQRLMQTGSDLSVVSGVFLTHLHSDEVVGLPDLWLTGWLLSGRETPLPLYGPPGTAAMAGHLRQAFEFDIRFRIEDDKSPAAGAELRTTDIREGVVFEADGVKVTAFEVDHRPVTPAFGYRVDYAGRSVVIAGDTRLSKNLIKYAAGVDLLIHPVADASERFLTRNPAFGVVLGHSTSAAEAGALFNEVKPKLAVYSHIVLREITSAELVLRTREAYDGPLVVGQDLSRFVVAADDITVFQGR